MEKINEFFKEIRQRLSSPIFSSFLLSWLLINWRIIIAIFFYKQEQLITDGYISLFDLIQKQLKNPNSFWLPFLISLAYTFLYPIIKNCIIAFQYWANKWGTTWHLSISKTGQVAMEKYLQLREKYSGLIAKLENIVKEEGEIGRKVAEQTHEIILLNRKIEGLERDKNSLHNDLTAWSKSDDSSFLTGTWEFSLITTLTNERIVKEFHILSGIATDRSENITYRIIAFFL